MSEPERVPSAVARLRRERAAVDTFEASRSVAEGQLTPRRRIAELVDPGTFLELAPLAQSQQAGAGGPTIADGVLAGWARIAGHEVGVIAEDPVVLARTDAQVAGNKRLRVLNTCAVKGNPVVYLADGPETMPSAFRPGQGRLFGFVGRQWPEPAPSQRTPPTVTLVLGPCWGRAAEIAAGSDLVIATPRGRVGAPPGISADELMPEIVHRVVGDDREAISAVRGLFASLDRRSARSTGRPAVAPRRELGDEWPGALSLDDLVGGLFDEGDVDLHSDGGFASGTAALEGHEVAFAATADRRLIGSSELAGVHDMATASRERRIPLLLVQDTDGYDPVQSRSPDFLRLLSSTIDLLGTTLQPKLCVVTGRGHVLGTFVLGGRQLGVDVIVALPWARVAALDVPWYVPGAVPESAIDGPWLAAGLGHVDELVAPSELRRFLGVMLTLFAHGRDVAPPEVQRAGRYIDDISKV